MKITRRQLITSTGVLGGGALVGFAVSREGKHQQANRELGTSDERFATAWIGIDQSSQITVFVPHVEMGQGVHTALAMMAADELDADWSMVTVKQAPALNLYTISDRFSVRDGASERFVKDLRDFLLGRDDTSGHTQNTAASSSVRATGELVMRNAGAAARELFVEAAARRWGVPSSECKTELSTVQHSTSGQSLAYGDLVDEVAESSPSSAPVLKTAAQYKLMGRPLQRLDIPHKVTGEAVFGSDSKPAGLLYAALVLPPVAGSTVVSVEADAIRDLPGVDRVVELEDGVAVVADNSWRALQAAEKLNINWGGAPEQPESIDQLYESLEQLLESGQGTIALQQGEATIEEESPESFLQQSYRVPYLAHAAMEPMSCTVQIRGQSADVWVSTQDPLSTRRRIAQIASLSEDNVNMHPCFVGGAFGRRLPIGWNVIDHAVRIADQFDVPVMTLLSREEDMQHDYYRPATASVLRAELDAEGGISKWHHRFTGPLRTPAAARIPYSVPNILIEEIPFDHPLPLGNWRSIDFSQHTFFVESFIDEIAHSLSQDPLSYRLSLLEGKPRHRQALQAAAEMSGYGEPHDAGYGLGCAIVECFGSVVAQVIEVSISLDGKPIVHRVSCAIDCGRVINPDTVAAQVESAILYALGAALQEEIHIAHGRIVEGNFDDYAVLRLADCPPIDVRIIESSDAPGGVGEAATPPVAAALANAVFQASGVRVRKLPLLGHELPTA